VRTPVKSASRKRKRRVLSTGIGYGGIRCATAMNAGIIIVKNVTHTT
jgi:hypothetical protein